MRCIVLVLVLCLWGSAASAHENAMGRLGTWQEWQDRGDILDAVKRVRKLELDIAELEEKARGRKSEGGEVAKAIPRVRAVERGRGAVYRAQLHFPDGRLVWVLPKTGIGDMDVVAITRERVLVRKAGVLTELMFE